MQIRILGCSGGIGPGLRTTTLLIDGALLIDAGTGVGDLQPAELAAIKTVLLTHAHLDHICGLAFMADNLFGEIDHPLKVHAIPEALAVLREHIFNWKVWPDFTALPDAEHPLIVLEPLTPATSLTLGALSITPFRVSHTVPAVGYIVDDGNGVFAFSGDTYAHDRIWDFLNALPRLDHLMIEVAFPNHEDALAQRARHFTPGRLGSELGKLRHRPMLHLTHAKPGSETLIAEQCTVALAGWQYRHLRIGDEIVV
ncbi:3',5'-cyclic-nucleotide phosphodiesterase [Nevskia ramosa]|uniref:3',5'-cyclic-nucleotide phosphodiesterase n=1 Tax=Nevskia ramosa TaxID=64002 RepID=UPI003D10242E